MVGKSEPLIKVVTGPLNSIAERNGSQIAQASTEPLLNAADSWILNNQDLAVDLYASSTGLKKDVAKNALDRRSKPSPIRPITSVNIESQQQIADLFYKEKLIPKQIKIQDAILNSESNR